MQVTPDFSGFEVNYQAGQTQIVSTILIADLETPVSAMMKLAKGQPNSFLLESVEGGSIRGCYPFIGLNPDLIWRCYGNFAEINRSALTDPDIFEPCPVANKAGALASYRSLLKESKFELPENMPPMASGLFGYMGYDMVRLAENVPDDNPSTIDLPDGQYIRPTIIAIFDTIEDRVTVVTPIWPAADQSAEQTYEQALARLGAVLDDFASNLPRQQSDIDLARLPEPTSNMTPEEYHEIVAKGKEYIHAGDVFQVVLSQRFSVPFDLPPLAFYRALRRVNPSPFLFFLDFGVFSIIGSSPELLVRLRDGRVTIRPLAGTRPRGNTVAEDHALAEDLLADPKELAEHLMLLDLGRNDVGRVAKVGTVEVTDRNVIELYSHVMHIVSNVEGDFDADKFDEI
ncbi:MAG: chorismate-binding protein, partial [Rhodospirillales bacterium]|nr:chorismate-binding protein [Rhodospirillales bacterium]